MAPPRPQPGSRQRDIIDFGKHRNCPGRQHGLEGGHESKGRDHDFITGPDAAGGKGRAQRRGSAELSSMAVFGPHPAAAASSFSKVLRFPVALTRLRQTHTETAPRYPEHPSPPCAPHRQKFQIPGIRFSPIQWAARRADRRPFQERFARLEAAAALASPANNC
jgi:hypothetical protein